MEDIQKENWWTWDLKYRFGIDNFQKRRRNTFVELTAFVIRSDNNVISSSERFKGTVPDLWCK